MRKDEFLKALKAKLSKNKIDDIGERVKFYSEMLDDLIEEGIPEEEAVQKIYGSLDFGEDKLSSPKDGTGARTINLKTYQKVLFWVGTPLWLSLLIALLSAVLALFITFWALIGVLWALVGCAWAVFGAIAISGAVGILFGVFELFVNAPAGLALIGASFVCFGLSFPAFLGCKLATRGGAWLTKMSSRSFKINTDKQEDE